MLPCAREHLPQVKLAPGELFCSTHIFACECQAVPRQAPGQRRSGQVVEGSMNRIRGSAQCAAHTHNGRVLIGTWLKVSLKHPDVLDFKPLAGPISGAFVPVTAQGQYKVGSQRVGGGRGNTRWRGTGCSKGGGKARYRYR